MDLGISGKVAFVAGGSKGIGRASAKFLAAEGCRVAVVARNQADIDSTLEELHADGGVAVGVSADLSTVEGTDQAVATVKASFGDPDIVVGLTMDHTFGEFFSTKNEDFERIFRVLTMSQVYLARAVIPAMKEKRWGRFIHINAVVGKEMVVSFPHILHTTVRPSTVALLRVLAHEVASYGITINTIGPGVIRTPTTEAFVTQWMGMSIEERDKQLAGGSGERSASNEYGLERIPIGRDGEAEEVGSLVAFLASQYAAYITGEFITVDGGMHRFLF